MDDFLSLENRHTGEILHMCRMRDPQGQIVLELDGSLPPHRSGPPLHVHFASLEQGTVKAGTLGTLCGGKKIVAQAGSRVAFPKGVEHKWWNAGEDLLEFHGWAVPVADLDCYLQAIFAVLNASESGRPDLFYMAHVAWRHRQTQAIVTPPLFIQKILFPVILLIGRVLGKYRGSSWPGSPESCKGAPLSANVAALDSAAS